MNRSFFRLTRGSCLACVACLAPAFVGCGGNNSSQFKNGGGSGSPALSGNGGGVLSGSSSGGLGGGSGASGDVFSADGDTGIYATVRDFKFYDSTDPTTNQDFENPPYGFDANGNPQPMGQINYGPWDDREITTDTLGSDGKPVYASASSTTLTTHGQASFNQWYNDVSGTNINKSVPLPLTYDASTGTYSYDSAVSGIVYGVDGQAAGALGFFPIDDGTPYATAFGDQVPTNAEPPYSGAMHNYSFTVEIDTTFTYNGGETFTFTGDDDVFVYINGKRVINLGGIHGPEMAMVAVDSLGLTVGNSYPLNFFSAERHVTGSNIRFATTLHLQPAGAPPK
ncbi:MAG TPA: fibro-slime domain-containing protein [Polyangiaceae bacterium]|nr:fibro-slime domain-containing protein [Polyangiaceae bacterium]